jgi:hypothetical protein
MFDGDEFKYGKTNYANARKSSMKCSWFVMDDEDECVDDELRSCYNCQYRRWTEKSFCCMKKG